MVTCRHLAVIGFALDDIDDPIKEIGASVLTIERSRYHRVNGGQMSLALGASVDALAGEITAVFHSHVEWGC